MNPSQRSNILKVAGVSAGLLFLLVLVIFFDYLGQDVQHIFNAAWIGCTLVLFYMWFVTQSNKLKGGLFLVMLALLLLNEIREQNTGFPFMVSYKDEPQTFVLILTIESILALIYVLYLWTSDQDPKVSL